MSGQTNADAAREWLDTAGTWHMEVDPQRFAGADPATISYLRARLAGLTTLARLRMEPAGPAWDRVTMADLVMVVEQVLPRGSFSDHRLVIAATIDAIGEDISDLWDWFEFGGGFSLDEGSSNHHLDNISNRLWQLMMEADGWLDALPNDRPTLRDILPVTGLRREGESDNN